MTKEKLLVVLGPTASGKTSLACRLAEKFSGSILSADSRQVYRRMDIGTGKDLGEYQTDSGSIPYYLIDMVEAGESYNLSEFLSDFKKAFEEVKDAGKLPILCGGTGLYIEGVLRNYTQTVAIENPEQRAQLQSKTTEELVSILKEFEGHELIDASTRKRIIRGIEILQSGQLQKEKEIPFNTLIIGLNPDRELRRNRISTRLKQRLDQGLIDEVKSLIQSGIPPDKLIFYGLEYKYITLYLLGQMSFEEMSGRLETEIHRYAKRQMTFFRSMEKKGLEISWVDPLTVKQPQIECLVENWLEGDS